jgi:translation initiation factor IF-1
LPARAPASRTRRAGTKPPRAEEKKPPTTDAERNPNTQTFRTSGTVKTVLRDAKFLVETEQGMEVVARAAGRMRRGRKIRILAGDAVDIEVSLYDPTRGRIIWRHV